MDRIRHFFSEVSRRRVLATTALYIIAAWVAVQVADLSIEAGFLRLPLRSVFIAAFLGFPIALVVAWSYDITRRGVVRTPPVGAAADFDPALRKKDYVRFAVLGVAWVLANLIVYSPMPVDRSIAILPFENRGHDPQGADLAFGIRLDLQSQLETLKEVKVIASTSVDSIDQDLPTAVMAQELGAAFIMKGTVERVLDRIRVSVTLIDAKRDEQAFSNSWDRQLDLTSLFDIRDDIAGAITSSLRTELSPQDLERFQARQTESFAAHQAYLLGRQRMARRATGALAEAVDYFQEAIDLDPNYAQAWVGLAESSYLNMLYGSLPRKEWFPKIEAASNRARELDRFLGEAYAITAIVQEEVYGDDVAAEKAFRRALELNPNYGTVHHWFGTFLSMRDRPEEALYYKQRALELDPLSANTNLVVGNEMRKTGRFEEAMTHFRKAIEIDPLVPGSYERIAEINRFVLGRMDEAVIWQIQGIARDPDELMGSVFLGFIYLDLGSADQAELWFNRAIEMAPPNFPFVERLLEPLYIQRGEVEASLNIGRQTITLEPNGRYTLANLRNADLRAGRFADARDRYEDAVPDLLRDEAPVVDASNFELAIDLALVLQMTGERERADRLLDGSLGVISTMPRLGMNGYGIADVLIFALRGESEQALAALRSAVDQGWRAYWWIFLEHDESLSSIRDRSEFQAMLSEIRDDMASQLARVRQLQASGDLAAVPDP